MSSSWPHPIKAVVFDNDGVIVDTVPLYVSVNSQLIGRPYPDYMKSRTNGHTDRDVCQILKDEFGLKESADELVQKRFSILKNTLPNCKTVPGVERIISTIKAKGMKMAVATSSKRTGFEMKIGNHKELFDNFDYIVCGDEVTKAKPAPEIFLTAAKRICDYPPENILVFEDAPAGIKAANDAGMASCFIWREPRDPIPELAMYDAKPTIMIKSFDEFDFNSFDFQ